MLGQRAGKGVAGSALQGKVSNHHYLVDVSDIFLVFFCSGEGKMDSDAPGRGGGDDFFFENPRRGGSSGRVRAGGRRVFAGNVGGRGGLFFFFGAEIPTRINSNHH